MDLQHAQIATESYLDNFPASFVDTSLCGKIAGVIKKKRG